MVSILDSLHLLTGSGGIRLPDATPCNFFTIKLPAPFLAITTGPLLLVPFIKLLYALTDKPPLFPWQLMQLAFNIG